MTTTKTLSRLLFALTIGISSISCANDDAEKVNAINASNTQSVDDTSDEITDPIAHGEKAHQVHCYKCHTDEVYTRDDRFVKSIDALSKQVVRCKDGADAPWFEEDADAVVQFLNKKYYRF